MKQFFFILLLGIGTAQYLPAQELDTLLVDSVGMEQERSYIIIDPVETMAMFPGGADSLRQYLELNNTWTVGRETIVGRVYVGFVVEEDGSITNVEIVKGLEESCNKEAIRLVKEMPKWKPAELQGQPVRTKMILPISFDGLK